MIEGESTSLSLSLSLCSHQIAYVECRALKQYLLRAVLEINSPTLGLYIINLSIVSVLFSYASCLCCAVGGSTEMVVQYYIDGV